LKLTEHFTKEEFERSSYAMRHGIDNFIGGDAMSCAADLCKSVLEPLRAAFGKPIVIDSGFRCGMLNKAVNGSAHSQHMLGQAVDIIASPKDLIRIAHLVQSLELPFDQLIYEGTWVHVSHASRNRGEVMTAVFRKGHAYYSTGIK